jgi:hypothetical protein
MKARDQISLFVRRLGNNSTRQKGSKAKNYFSKKKATTDNKIRLVKIEIVSTVIKYQQPNLNKIKKNNNTHIVMSRTEMLQR